VLLIVWGISYDKPSDQGLIGSMATSHLLCSQLTETIYRWRRIEVNGNLIRETQTKQVNSLGCEVRIDRFPWLNISDKETLRNSPCELNILDGIAAARKNGDRVDTFDMSEYDTYIAEYEGRNPSGTSQEEIQALDLRDSHRDDSMASHKRKKPPRRVKPPMLSYEQWSEGVRAFHDRLWSIDDFYDRIPSNTIYIAKDKNNKEILAVFPCGLECVYGKEEGRRYIDDTRYNIYQYAQSQPPPRVEDCRHLHHQLWVKENQHLQGPKGRCGVYHWGAWPELGKNRGPVLTKDFVRGGTRSNPKDGAYAKMYREETIKSLGPLTIAIDACFTAIDKPTRDAYHSAYRGLRPGARVSSTENDKEELFPLRAVLINALTEEHTDAGDWKGGWAWLGVFGNFSGGDICLSQLGVRVPMPEGSIVGLRGRELKHFIARWHGLRYSVVHFFKECLRAPQGREPHREHQGVNIVGGWLTRR
jgi:hypothetical protein